MCYPVAPGGRKSLPARLVATRAVGRAWHRWVVENRSGASGAVGAERVARAAPDGTTILYSNEVHLLLSLVQRNVSWKTDFYGRRGGDRLLRTDRNGTGFPACQR